MSQWVLMHYTKSLVEVQSAKAAQSDIYSGRSSMRKENKARTQRSTTVSRTLCHSGLCRSCNNNKTIIITMQVHGLKGSTMTLLILTRTGRIVWWMVWWMVSPGVEKKGIGRIINCVMIIPVLGGVSG